MSGVFIGTSGFSYKHWKGPFYPDGLGQARWFQYYAERFSTVELNVTFYRLPRESTMEKWRNETPEDFLFSLKGSRFITHVKRLGDVDAAVRSFMERAVLLGDKLAVVLWQLPPRFTKDVPKLRGLLRALSRYKARHAFEFRDKTWLSDDVAALLAEEGHAFVAADWPQHLVKPPVTTGFRYIRRHGHGGNYDTRYSKAELKADAAEIRRHLRQKRDVFIYFNNDYRGYAPLNALEIKRMIKA